jgi:hypothetical protein
MHQLLLLQELLLVEALVLWLCRLHLPLPLQALLGQWLG